MIKIEISNKTERGYYLVMIFSIIIAGLTYLNILDPMSIDNLLVMFGLGSLVGLIIFSILLKMNYSWKYPNVYVVTDDEVWRALYYEEGDHFAKYKLSSIKKLVLKNHRTKRIELWFKDNEDQLLEIFAAPYFEKCKDEWQRLFDEIQKRSPPEAEVIIK